MRIGLTNNISNGTVQKRYVTKASIKNVDRQKTVLSMYRCVAKNK